MEINRQPCDAVGESRETRADDSPVRREFSRSFPQVSGKIL